MLEVYNIKMKVLCIKLIEWDLLELFFIRLVSNFNNLIFKLWFLERMYLFGRLLKFKILIILEFKSYKVYEKLGNLEKRWFFNVIK